MVRLSSEEVGTVVLEQPDSGAWVKHADGDDVAVGFIGLSSQYPGLRYIVDDFLMLPSEVRYTGAGDDAFFLGRFTGHDGKDRNKPTARFGTLAMATVEPVRSPRGILQESFLVEMRSLSGYSGSPVFAYAGDFTARKAWPEFEDVEVEHEPIAHIRLLGLDWCHLDAWSDVFNQEGQPTGDRVRMNSGLMGVVPAWKIREALMQAEVVEARDRAKEASDSGD